MGGAEALQHHSRGESGGLTSCSARKSAEAGAAMLPGATLLPVLACPYLSSPVFTCPTNPLLQPRFYLLLTKKHVVISRASYSHASILATQ